MIYSLALLSSKLRGTPALKPKPVTDTNAKNKLHFTRRCAIFKIIESISLKSAGIYFTKSINNVRVIWGLAVPFCTASSFAVDKFCFTISPKQRNAFNKRDLRFGIHAQNNCGALTCEPYCLRACYEIGSFAF